jgi:hypothetical protein
MSLPQAPELVLLVVGVLHRPAFELPPVAERLAGEFGPVAEVSEALPFDFTDYYAREFGPGLLRRMIMFDELVDPGRLAAIKLTTNAVENAFRDERGQRQVNLDPGVLSAWNFVLATGKGYAHRPYLGSRIYADLTLVWKNGAFENLPWTYPDYAGEFVQRILARYRTRYLKKLHAEPQAEQAI